MGAFSDRSLNSLPAPTPAAAPPPGSRSLSVDPGIRHGLVPVAPGVRLHYVVAGEGEPVVLLPGWPQSWFTWRHIIPGLVRAGRTVYALDPRGFGDSDAPVEGYDLDTAADDLHVFMDRLGLLADGGVDIVTHDIGSWIAHAHVVRHPDDVKSIVLSDAYIPGISPDPPSGYPDAGLNARQWHFYFNRVEGLPEMLIQGREREYLSWFFGPVKLARTWAIEPDAFEEYLRVFLRPGIVRAGLNYYREVFNEAGKAASAVRRALPFRAPVLTMGGSYADGDNLFHTMRQFTDDVSNVTFEGVGHHVTEEAPEEMLAAILQFWSSLRSR